jgi:dipeptidyl aminopeptidase/acylaminoacyl peptidase
MKHVIQWITDRCRRQTRLRRQRMEWPMAALTIAAILGIPPYGHAAALEVYGRLPSIEDVALSPDGSRLAFVRTKGDSRTIVIVSLPDGRGVNTVQMGDHKLRNVTWADSEHLLITTSETGVFYGPADSVWLNEGEWFRLTVLDLGKNAFRTLPSTNNNRGLNILGVLSGSVMVRRHAGHTALFLPAMYSQGHIFGRILFRVDLATGEQTIAREGAGSTQGWLVDEEGQIVAEKSYLDHDQRWSLSIRRGKELSEVIAGHEAIDVPNVLGFGPDEGTLLMSSIVDGDPVWRLLSLKDGTLGPSMAEGRLLDRPIEDLRTNHMIGGTRVADDVQYVFFDDAAQQRWTAITRAFAGENVQLVSYSADFNELIVRVEGAKSGYRYEIVDMKTNRAEPLGDVYEGLGQPLEVRRVTYRAADGMEIPAYLTLPRGREPKNLPLVVLPHGGPAVRDTAEFHWWSQAIADQGYAVLRPNFRGSDLNWKFTSAGFGQWGRKMQTDLSDGVRYLAKEGIVDSARVCIMGGSYGGYAALAGVSLDPGVYRCAISIAGISDLKRLLQRAENRGSGTWVERYWDRFMGVTGPEDPVLDKLSPIRHLDAVNVPVLLIHGLDDTVVPFKQSSLMFEALTGAGKKVQLVTLKHEDHWLSRSETRLQMLQASVAFLRANNPPD